MKENNQITAIEKIVQTACIVVGAATVIYFVLKVLFPS